MLSLSGVFVTRLPESIFDDLEQLQTLELSLKTGVEAFALGYEVILIPSPILTGSPTK